MLSRLFKNFRHKEELRPLHPRPQLPRPQLPRPLSEAISPEHKTGIQPEWITPEIAEALESRSNWCLSSMQIDRLLINMHAKWIGAVRFRATRTISSLGGFGGYGSYGGDNIELEFDYSHISWEQLEAITAAHFDAHPAIVAARQRLHDAGIETKWSGEGEHCMSAFGLYVVVDEDSIKAVRQLAKEDAGITTAGEADEFDRVFDLYLKQNWGADWEEWREREPIVTWPPEWLRGQAAS